MNTQFQNLIEETNTALEGLEGQETALLEDLKRTTRHLEELEERLHLVRKELAAKQLAKEALSKRQERLSRTFEDLKAITSEIVAEGGREAAEILVKRLGDALLQESETESQEVPVPVEVTAEVPVEVPAEQPDVVPDEGEELSEEEVDRFTALNDIFNASFNGTSKTEKAPDTLPEAEIVPLPPVTAVAPENKSEFLEYDPNTGNATVIFKEKAIANQWLRWLKKVSAARRFNLEPKSDRFVLSIINVVDIDTLRQYDFESPVISEEIDPGVEYFAATETLFFRADCRGEVDGYALNVEKDYPQLEQHVIKPAGKRTWYHLALSPVVRSDIDSVVDAVLMSSGEEDDGEDYKVGDAVTVPGLMGAWLIADDSVYGDSQHLLIHPAGRKVPVVEVARSEVTTAELPMVLVKPEILDENGQSPGYFRWLTFAEAVEGQTIKIPCFEGIWRVDALEPKSHHLIVVPDGEDVYPITLAIRACHAYHARKETPLEVGDAKPGQKVRIAGSEEVFTIIGVSPDGDIASIDGEGLCPVELLYPVKVESDVEIIDLPEPAELFPPGETVVVKSVRPQNGRSRTGETGVVSESQPSAMGIRVEMDGGDVLFLLPDEIAVASA